MSLTKKAKVLKKREIKNTLAVIAAGRNAERNKVMFLLGLHSLRAKEIADLELTAVLDASGNIAQKVAVTNQTAKGSKGGREIFMSKLLREALAEYLPLRKRSESEYLITTQKSDKFSANAVCVFFQRLFKDKLGYNCSSHSMRRTFITEAARNIFQCGGSLVEVSEMAGHSSVEMTRQYVESDKQSKKKLMNVLYAGVR